MRGPAANYRSTLIIDQSSMSWIKAKGAARGAFAGAEGQRRRLPPALLPGSVRLPAQEGRNVELILFTRVMHRCLPAVLV